MRARRALTLKAKQLKKLFTLGSREHLLPPIHAGTTPSPQRRASLSPQPNGQTNKISWSMCEICVHILNSRAYTDGLRRLSLSPARPGHLALPRHCKPCDLHPATCFCPCFRCFHVVCRSLRSILSGLHSRENPFQKASTLPLVLAAPPTTEKCVCLSLSLWQTLVDTQSMLAAARLRTDAANSPHPTKLHFCTLCTCLAVSGLSGCRHAPLRKSPRA